MISVTTPERVVAVLEKEEKIVIWKKWVSRLRVVHNPNKPLQFVGRSNTSRGRGRQGGKKYFLEKVSVSLESGAQAGNSL